MSASDHLNYEQLQMFLPARQIVGGVTPGDAEPGEDHADVWAYKLDEAQDPDAYLQSTGPDDTLHESIRQHGVRDKVMITHGADGAFLHDGHHRVASAYDVNPAMEIPIEHNVPRHLMRNSTSSGS